MFYDPKRKTIVNYGSSRACGDNHNRFSIGIAFVGGFNCSTLTKNPDRFLSSESFTQSQWTTFSMFCESFYTVIPAGQAWGHNNVSNLNTDPGFDVPGYVKKKFSKLNTVARGDADGSALSPTQLIAATERL